MENTKTSNSAPKRADGVYYTQGNPFCSPAFAEWARQANLMQAKIIEPFAGANSLIETLQKMNQILQADSFDINPTHHNVQQRDTLNNFPTGYEACITNPPWLAKNSATRRKLPFPNTAHDNLYKYALEKCLDNCNYVAALVPESFIRAKLFQTRLEHFVSLTSQNMFADTDNPVGLALFTKQPTPHIHVWRDHTLIGKLAELEAILPATDTRHTAADTNTRTDTHTAHSKAHTEHTHIRFNDPHGNVGLIAIDNTRTASIRFCEPAELGDYVVRHSCRSITKLSVEGKVRIDDWNNCLAKFREQTQDVLMTAFKGLRKDGYYRRRLDWNTARRIIHYS